MAEQDREALQKTADKLATTAGLSRKTTLWAFGLSGVSAVITTIGVEAIIHNEIIPGVSGTVMGAFVTACFFKAGLSELDDYTYDVGQMRIGYDKLNETPHEESASETPWHGGGGMHN